MREEKSVTLADPGRPLVWSLWHFQADLDGWGSEDDELPHLLIGHFAQRREAEALRARMRLRSGLRNWPLGFRVGRERLDDARGSELGFIDPWDDDAPSADPSDILMLPEPTPGELPPILWDLWHFKVSDPSAAILPLNAKEIGLFSSPDNAAAAVAHRRRQPGFCDWPEGFRCYRRRLGVVFGLDGFRERYGWEAWRDSIMGGAGMGGAGERPAADGSPE